MAAVASDGQPCALCGRRGPALTKHHLIPRAMPNRKWARRRFGREAMQSRVIRVCQPCHRHIHATLAEKHMAHPEIARFVAWIGDKPAQLEVRSRDRRR